jgi:hypothetical protein
VAGPRPASVMRFAAAAQRDGARMPSAKSTPAPDPAWRPMFPTAAGGANAYLRQPAPVGVAPVVIEDGHTAAKSAGRKHRRADTDHAMVRSPSHGGVTVEQAALVKKFNDAMNLTVECSDLYHTKVFAKEANTAPKSTRKSAGGGLVNPWEVSKHQFQSMKSWRASDVKEGDLFYIAVPLPALTRGSIEDVVTRCRAHLTRVKKLLITTPNTARHRRWFLHDCHNNVLPRIIAKLADIAKFIAKHGESEVQTAVSLLLGATARATQPFGFGGSPSPQRGGGVGGGVPLLHSGNFLDVHHHLKAYFAMSPSSRKQQQTGAVTTRGSPGAYHSDGDSDLLSPGLRAQVQRWTTHRPRATVSESDASTVSGIESDAFTDALGDSMSD